MSYTYPISVVLPVYNSEQYLHESIQSILAQTFTDFEFIIINDGSTDQSSSIIHRYTADSRIKWIEHSGNKGNYTRRNEGCRLAKGKYICVMDADDIAMPTRFERQFEVMEDIPELLACGTGLNFTTGGDMQKPAHYELIKVMLLNNNMFLHPSLMIRSKAMQEIDYYDETYLYSSDYDLMCRLALKGVVINLPEVLMTYRWHPAQISSQLKTEQTTYADQIRRKYFEKTGFLFTLREYKWINKIMNWKADPEALDNSKYLIEKMKIQASKMDYFQYPVFCKVMDMVYDKYQTTCHPF